MAKDVKIIINKVQPVGNIGFGCPLILQESATSAVAYAECSTLAEVVTAGFATTTKVYKAAQLMFMQNHCPAKIAVCAATDAAEEWLADEANVRKDWRQLVVVNETETDTDINAVAAVIEAQATYPKFYYANVDYDSTETYTVDGIDRTVLFYYTPTEAIPSPVAALAGEVGGCTVGSYTLNNMVLTGLPGLEISETACEAIHTKGGITCILAAGDAVASEGHAAGGEYVDNTDNNDYIVQQLEYKIQKVKNNNLKIPYTNAGIGMLEAAALSVMQDAVDKTIIGSATDYTVAFRKREETSESDRAARKYFGGQLSWKLAGAIHETTVSCEVSV